MKYLPNSQDDLPERSMKDSHDYGVIPLLNNFQLRDKYIATSGHVRLGRLMEDMDLFAGHIAFKHAYYPGVPEGLPSPIVIVTISVSQIEFLDFIKVPPDLDVRLSGHVSWVGNTSLEIAVWIHQFSNGVWNQITRALFLMASRNSINTGAAFVNRLKFNSEEEKKLFAGGEERKLNRKKKMKESLLTTVPTAEELHTIHSLFVDTISSKELFSNKRILPSNSKWMHDTVQSSLIFCHPQHRNIHNKIFGGFLMRHALELSWIIGFMHGLNIPKLVRISDIGFYHPVEVGSIVKMFGCITYTEDNFIQIFVIAEALGPMKLESKESIVFNFTYDLGKKTDNVIPQSYPEAIQYLDGRRNFKNKIHLEIGDSIL
ncbi:acyl-coenzyme A thioesterase 9, putative [Pediculus humanus corporis]|uniref:Acyl-coenzyme A thioesterase 9, putative n=1 Tax=Pediculus humanus subsp. corporis TaxID=121224 RepID=E0VFS6_PEDHC|nr:acyl-coenzyme A thioesterase 9, putative [Pediculus humanus corporis]EEB12232.1 acyl-coenzyme A thioesterase 9, putative [Pediculus humanus corporis]